MQKTKKRRRISKTQIRQQAYGLFFIAPWLIGFFALVFYPLTQSFWFSMNNIKLVPSGRKFFYVQFNNYRDVFLKDLFFVQRIFGFIIDTMLRFPIIVVFSLIIAMLINSNIKFKGTFRTIYFLPVIIVSGPVMAELVNQGATTIPSMNTVLILGILNSFLPEWIATLIGNMFQQIIMILWYSGIQILIFLAALQKVDSSLFEAAKIDGGGAWECFWKITLPILKPMILLNSVYTIITLANSDQNEIINLIYTNMFSATRGYGFASAMAWMYSIILTIIVIIVFLLFKEKKEKPIRPELLRRRSGR